MTVFIYVGGYLENYVCEYTYRVFFLFVISLDSFLYESVDYSGVRNISSPLSYFI